MRHPLYKCGFMVLLRFLQANNARIFQKSIIYRYHFIFLRMSDDWSRVRTRAMKQLATKMVHYWQESYLGRRSVTWSTVYCWENRMDRSLLDSWQEKRSLEQRLGRHLEMKKQGMYLVKVWDSLNIRFVRYNLYFTPTNDQ